MRPCLPLITALLLLLAGGPACAQTTSEHELRWQFLLGLTRFINWPAPPESLLPTQPQPFELCVIGQTPYSDASFQTQGIKVKDQDLQRHIFDRVLPTVTELEPCRLLYFADDLEDIEVNYYLQYFSDKPLLTVSSRSNFSRMGGMVQFLQVDRKLRFKLNLHQAIQAGLSLHPSLAKLALPGDSER